MAKTLAALALALILLASPALAWNEPENFRGIPWGAPMDQAQETLLKTWPAGVTPPATWRARFRPRATWPGRGR